jgi:hypothetical protein
MSGGSCCDCSQPLLALNGGPLRFNLQPESEVLRTLYRSCATDLAPLDAGSLAEPKTN